MNRLYSTAELKELSSMWREPDFDVIPAAKRAKFQDRVKAVKMYIQGYTLKEIHAQTGVNTTRITSYVKKCLKIGPDGQMLGFDALIPNKRTQPTKGRYIEFFESEPEIKEKVLNKVFSNRDGVDKNMTIQAAFNDFMKQLRESNRYDLFTYPFTLSDKGRKNFYRLIGQYMLTEYGKRRLSKEARALEEATSGDQKLTDAPLVPFSVVEFDAHKIDNIWSIEVPSENGDTILVPTGRVWLLAMIDIASRAIIGYSVSLSGNYDHTDVLLCMENAIRPFQSITGMSDCMPSDTVPETAWALFDEMRLDNALSHLAEGVLLQASTLGCSFTFGPVADPIRRPHIERFFKTIEELCFHRLPSTTGSNPQDVRRDNAERDAIRYHVTIDMIHAIIEEAIAVYNNRSHDALGGYTPLQVMQQSIDRGLIPRHLPIDKREKFKLTIIDSRTVRGNRNNGVRPYISFESNRYSSPKLANDYGLIGEKLTLRIWPQNICKIDAFLPDGSFLDTLSIKNLPESTVIDLKEMKRINKFKNKEKLSFGMTENVIDKRIEAIEKNAIESKKSATEYARAQTKLKKPAHTKKTCEDTMYSDEDLIARLKLINRKE